VRGSARSESCSRQHQAGKGNCPAFLVFSPKGSLRGRPLLYHTYYWYKTRPKPKHMRSQKPTNVRTYLLRSQQMAATVRLGVVALRQYTRLLTVTKELSWSTTKRLATPRQKNTRLTLTEWSAAAAYGVGGDCETFEKTE